jgi:chitin synthase
VGSFLCFLSSPSLICIPLSFPHPDRLKYVKSAKASTDVPTTVAEFISQRRRWLNGSLFASIHATVFFFRIWTSGQGFFRKLALQFEFIYNALQLLFTWTSLANFYLAFFFVSFFPGKGERDTDEAVL